MTRKEMKKRIEELEEENNRLIERQKLMKEDNDRLFEKLVKAYAEKAMVTKD